MARERRSEWVRNIGVIVVSITAIAFVFQLAGAGSLFPTSSPGGSLHSIQELYDSMVGDFDTQDTVAKKDRSALNWAKCVVGRVKGYDKCQFDFNKSPSPICYSGTVVAVSPPGLGTASVRWEDIAIDPKTTTVSEFQLDFGGAVVSGSYGDMSIDVDCNDLGTSVIDAYTCNGSACDFCSTFLDVQDNTAVSTCAGSPPAGVYPDLVGLYGIAVEMQPSDTATASWDTVILNESGPIDAYSHEINGGGSIPGKYAVLDCSHEAISPVVVEWTGCNGVFCNSIFNLVYIQDPYNYCP